MEMELLRKSKVSIFPDDWEPECDKIGGNADGSFEADADDQFFVLLILAYVQLSLPAVTLIASCIQARMEGSKYSLSSNILGLASIAGASCYLSFYYIDWDPTEEQQTLYKNLFKSSVGISMGITCIGGLILLFFTLYFLAQLLCRDCEFGNRAKSLVSFICASVVLVLLISAPAGTVILGWKYAFGSCDSVLDCIAVHEQNCTLLVKSL
ncbi:Oidioi.mRNA.OKI2018_I69.XSR.g13288.t1.cds [Oikopleura dioica]|uniref:Oidioi.mRNA.OKI2018_I69.XSR.g13288.t1.cds n=1 Tax=Oikopleura dioica TaxID=34765 RepID=A0ABN7SA50_OIKDI|nr:Oidioi.mRNA.OKI2018_I69.XSR.g13288.t1.cds [Oikopleura dioica]